MKILVADDDRIARKVLRAFLEDAGYTVVLAEDGKQAVEILMSAGAPPIVILDWVMPGMTGPEVCAKLRAARLPFRPYVVMLSSKHDKNEVAAGLDAGADDFLSKPFNLAELLARLRVAHRMIEYELTLYKKIAQLEALEQRHILLGELIGHPANANQPENDTSNSPQAAAAPATLTFPILSPARIATLAVSALEQLNLGKVRVIETPSNCTAPRETYSAWVALIATKQQRWFDLVLEAEPGAVSSLFEKTLSRTTSGSPSKQAFIAEALTIISLALRSELRQQACETLMPYLSCCLRIDRVRHQLPIAEDVQPIHLELAGHAVRLTVVEQPAPYIEKASPQLQLYDVLAEAYPPARAYGAPFLNRGAILNDHHIEKITGYTETTSEQQPIPVFTPTPLADFFNHDGES